MKLIAPIETTTTNVTTNIPITDTLWSNTAVYTEGQVIYKGITLYESLTNNNGPTKQSSAIDINGTWASGDVIIIEGVATSNVSYTVIAGDITGSGNTKDTWDAIIAKLKTAIDGAAGVKVDTSIVTVLATSPHSRLSLISKTAGTAFDLNATATRGGIDFSTLIENSGANDPDTTNNEVSDEPKWLVLGAVNGWRMFDGKIGSKTTGAAPAPGSPSVIEVEIEYATMIDHVTFFGLDATRVWVQLDDGTLTWETELELYRDPLVDWKEFFFSPLVPLVSDISSELVDEDGESLLSISGTLTIRIENENSPAKCGLCIVGRGVELGKTMYGIGTGILSYSKKITDDFGRTYLAKGSNAKLMNLTMDITPDEYSRCQQILAAFDGQAVVWNANEEGTDNSSFVLFGFSRDFRLVMPQNERVECSLDLEGLI